MSRITDRSSVPRGKHLLLSARCAPLARQFFKAPSGSLSSRLHLTITISTRSRGGSKGPINRSIIVRDGLDFATMAETGAPSEMKRDFSFPFFFFFRFLRRRSIENFGVKQFFSTNRGGEEKIKGKKDIFRQVSRYQGNAIRLKIDNTFPKWKC